jgi:hypothetical protein
LRPSYARERCVSRHEFENVDEARVMIGAYIDHYRLRMHARLGPLFDPYFTYLKARCGWYAGRPASARTAVLVEDRDLDAVAVRLRRGRRHAHPQLPIANEMPYRDAP